MTISGNEHSASSFCLLALIVPMLLTRRRYETTGYSKIREITKGPAKVIGRADSEALQVSESAPKHSRGGMLRLDDANAWHALVCVIIAARAIAIVSHICILRRHKSKKSFLVILL